MQESVPPSSDEDEPDRSAKRPRTEEPEDLEQGSAISSNPKKFNPVTASKVASLLSHKMNFPIPSNMLNQHWKNKYLELSSLAVSSSTWKCRLSSLNKLKLFANSTGTSISWPLSEKFRNGFIIWCFGQGKVSANTVDKYLVHLNSIQSFLGFKKFKKKLKPVKSSAFRFQKCW